MPADPNKFQPAAASRTALREATAKFSAKARKTELVPVEFDGESATYEVHKLTAGERWDLLDAANVAGVNDEGEAVSKFSLAAYGPRLLQLAVRDPHSGQRVWSEHEIDDIRDLPTEVTEPLTEAASRLAGLNKGAREAARNGSGATGGGATPTSSPTNSAPTSTR